MIPRETRPGVPDGRATGERNDCWRHGVIRRGLIEGPGRRRMRPAARSLRLRGRLHSRRRKGRIQRIGARSQQSSGVRIGGWPCDETDPGGGSRGRRPSSHAPGRRVPAVRAPPICPRFHRRELDRCRQGERPTRGRIRNPGFGGRHGLAQARRRYRLQGSDLHAQPRRAHALRRHDARRRSKPHGTVRTEARCQLGADAVLGLEAAQQGKQHRRIGQRGAAPGSVPILRGAMRVRGSRSSRHEGREDGIAAARRSLMRLRPLRTVPARLFSLRSRSPGASGPCGQDPSAAEWP